MQGRVPQHRHVAQQQHARLEEHTQQQDNEETGVTNDQVFRHRSGPGWGCGTHAFGEAGGSGGAVGVVKLVFSAWRTIWVYRQNP